MGDYTKGSKNKPVYMVTGLKTTRSSPVMLCKSGNSKSKIQIRLQQPGGLPIKLGPKLNYSKEVIQEIGFEGSTDFIIGIRVKKLMFKKHWLLRNPERHLLFEEHNKGATMIDDDAS